MGLGGGSMRPNAYGASGSDSKTGNFRRGTARKRHWLMPRISFLPSRSVSDRRGHIAMRNSHWPMGLDIFGVNCARWSMTMHRASLLERRAVLAGLSLAFPELRFALSLTSTVRIRHAKTFRGPVSLNQIFVTHGQMCGKRLPLVKQSIWGMRQAGGKQFLCMVRASCGIFQLSN